MLETFIVVYTLTDGCTYINTYTVPVLATSKEELTKNFEFALAAYEPDSGVTHFFCGGQFFEYSNFIEWSEKKITPRRSTEVYDYVLPDIMSVQEWAVKSLQYALWRSSREETTIFRAVDTLAPIEALSLLQKR